MSNETRDIIDLQLAVMNARLRELLDKIARRCAPVWSKPRELHAIMRIWIERIPYCRLLYGMDTSGIQISANLHATRDDHESVGQNLSHRPYFSNKPLGVFSLSEVYVSRVSRG